MKSPANCGGLPSDITHRGAPPEVGDGIAPEGREVTLQRGAWAWGGPPGGSSCRQALPFLPGAASST